MNIYVLNSVGSAISKDTMMVYPLYANGKVDFENPVDVNELSEEWFDSLSIQDHEILFEIL